MSELGFSVESSYLSGLVNRIDLHQIPFSERGSRLLVYREGDCLAIRLAERWVKLNNQLSAYRKRPPILDQLTLLDDQGNPLAWQATSYPHCLVLSGSHLGSPGRDSVIYFLDPETLMINLPKAVIGLRFQARMDQAILDRRGGVLRMMGELRRNLAYTTNARILENLVGSSNGDYLSISLKLDATAGNRALLLNITPRLGFNRWIPDPRAALKRAEKTWHEWFAAVPEVKKEYQEQYYYAWWIMRMGLLSPRYFTTREVMAPSKSYYIGSWQWDNFFHALAYRHIDAKLAQDQLRILLDHQREDGMIPDAIHDEGTVTHLDFPVTADVTKPPLIAWAAWKLYELDHDREFLDEIYGPIVKWNRWWFEKNDLDGNGLCEYQHPFSSGLDDSPLWDAGMPVESPDLNTYLCLQQDTLARIAREINLPEDAKLWRERSQKMVEQMLRWMWDPVQGVFWASHLGKRVEVLTPVSLLPLLTGQMPADISRRLVDHLKNPTEFWVRYPVPSVAMNYPQFDPEQMWRGPTWVNINYLLIEGLFRSGYKQLGQELRQQTLKMLAEQKDLCEYYHPIRGEKPPKAAPIFGWSAALFIDMAIQASQQESKPTT